MKPEERRHHSYSPSSLQMFEACELFGKRSTAGEKALTGTKQHKVTETGQDDNSLSDEQIAHAAECSAFADAKVAEVVSKYPGAYYQDILEPYLPIDDRRWEVAIYDDKTYTTKFVWEDSTTAGYADRLVVFPALRRALLFDWKFGLWPVEDAQNNLQGICYILGAFRVYDVDVVEVFFKLPQQKDVTSAAFTRDQIKELYLRVRVVVERAEFAARNPNFERATPNVPACMFCSRVGQCHKVQELVLKVGQKYHPLEFPESIDTTLLRDPDNFAKGMRLAQVVTEWAKSYKSLGTNQVLTGRVSCPEGFRIATFSEREIVDPAKFREAALRYVSDEEYQKTLNPAIGKIETLIREKAPRGLKDQTVEEFGKILFELSAVQKTDPVPYLKAVPKKRTNTETE